MLIIRHLGTPNSPFIHWLHWISLDAWSSITQINDLNSETWICWKYVCLLHAYERQIFKTATVFQDSFKNQMNNILKSYSKSYPKPNLHRKPRIKSKLNLILNNFILAVLKTYLSSVSDSLSITINLLHPWVDSKKLSTCSRLSGWWKQNETMLCGPHCS